MTKAARLRAGRTEDACPRAHAENACPPAHAEDACPRRTRKMLVPGARGRGQGDDGQRPSTMWTPGSRLSARAVLSVAHGIKDAGEGRCRPDKREDRRLPQEMQDLRPSARSFSRPPGPKTASEGQGTPDLRKGAHRVTPVPALGKRLRGTPPFHADARARESPSRRAQGACRGAFQKRIAGQNSRPAGSKGFLTSSPAGGR